MVDWRTFWAGTLCAVLPCTSYFLSTCVCLSKAHDSDGLFWLIVTPAFPGWEARGAPFNEDMTKGGRVWMRRTVCVPAHCVGQRPRISWRLALGVVCSTTRDPDEGLVWSIASLLVNHHLSQGFKVRPTLSPSRFFGPPSRACPISFSCPRPSAPTP